MESGKDHCFRKAGKADVGNAGGRLPHDSAEKNKFMQTSTKIEVKIGLSEEFDTKNSEKCYKTFTILCYYMTVPRRHVGVSEGLKKEF